MPPALPAANDRTRTPNRSSRRLDPRGRAAEREDKGADEIEHQQERFHRVLPSQTGLTSALYGSIDRTG